MTHRIYKNEHCDTVLNYVRKNFKTTEGAKQICIENISESDAQKIQSTMFRTEGDACKILCIPTSTECDDAMVAEIRAIMKKAGDDVRDIILKRVNQPYGETQVLKKVISQYFGTSEFVEQFFNRL